MIRSYCNEEEYKNECWIPTCAPSFIPGPMGPQGPPGPASEKIYPISFFSNTSFTDSLPTTVSLTYQNGPGIVYSDCVWLYSNYPGTLLFFITVTYVSASPCILTMNIVNQEQTSIFGTGQISLQLTDTITFSGVICATYPAIGYQLRAYLTNLDGTPITGENTARVVLQAVSV